MTRHIAILEVGVRQLVVVRRRVAWSDLARNIKEMFDTVYSGLEAHPEAPARGPNVCVYRDATSDDVELEVGVEVEARYEGDGLLHSSTPACQAARTLHHGEYSSLGKTHDEVDAWCKANDISATGMAWEVYGEWHDDPSHRITEVFHAVEFSQR